MTPTDRTEDADRTFHSECPTAADLAWRYVADQLLSSPVLNEFNVARATIKRPSGGNIRTCCHHQVLFYGAFSTAAKGPPRDVVGAMASPVGVSDLLSLAIIARDIYRYWQTAPEDLKDLVKKFDYVGKQLERLNAIIVASGWSQYDKTADLRLLFKEAKAFFEKHQKLLHESAGGPSKGWKLARLKLDEDERERIESQLDEHVRMMEEFKTNVMFLASVRTLQGSRTSLQRQSGPSTAMVANQPITQTPRPRPVPRLQQLVEEARMDSDVISVISEATTALQFATKLRRRAVIPYQPNLEAVITSSPELVALSSPTDRDSIENFIRHSEELVENLKLYTREAMPTKHIKDLAQFVAHADKLTRDLRPSKAGMSAEVRSLHLPTIEPSPNSFSDSILESRVFKRWVNSSEGSWKAIGPLDHQPSLTIGQPARSITRTASTQTDSDNIFSMRSLSLSQSEVGAPAKEHIELTGWVKVYAGKQTSSQRITCGLDITRSEGSTCIWAVATSRSRKLLSPQKPAMPEAMTPDRLMRGHLNDQDRDGEGRFRTFQHSFSNVVRPVPHVLHPSVEGPAERDPYSITFHQAQYFVEEGYPHKWTEDLKYIFANADDRDVVRSKIFGKELLRSAGTEKITFNYIACHQHTISLWKDETLDVKTITFYRDPPNNKSNPRGDVEYKILGITDLRRAQRDSEPLPLNVEQINNVDVIPTPNAIRQSSILSLPSTKSSKTRSRDDMSCSIYFSDLEDKKEFVRILRSRQTSQS